MYAGVIQRPRPPSASSSFDYVRPGDSEADADADRHVDQDTDASVDNSGIHEEDDMKGSDGWRLQIQSDVSTASSRVTTPDLPLPAPLLLSSGLTLDGSVKSWFPSRPSVMMPHPPPPPPPPPLSPPPPALVPSSDHRPPRETEPGQPQRPAQNRPPTPDPPSRRHPHTPPQALALSRRPPPPPPSDHTPSLQSGHHATMPPPPPPPPPPPDRPSDRQQRMGEPAKWEQLQQMLHSPHVITDGDSRQSHGLPTSRGGRHPGGRDRRKARGTPGKARSYTPSNSSGSASSISPNPQMLDNSSDSDSSIEDPIAYRNARNFPPRLPAAPSHRSAHIQSKSSATNIITDWVSRYENAKSSLRQPRSQTEPRVQSDHARSDDEESDASDASSQDEIETLWQQLKAKRTRLVDIKKQMASRRKDLRELRRKKDDSDNAFMSVIRPILVNPRGLLHTSQSLLDRRLADMQRVRTEYHFLESNYEGLEVALDEEEEELSGLETRFFGILAAGRTKPVRPPEADDVFKPAQTYPSDVPYELTGISAEGPSEELHPLWRKLMSAMGDLENAKEEHEELLYAKNEYEYDRELKESVGKEISNELSKEMREFFDDFPAAEARISESIRKLEQGVQRLTQLCIEKKALRKHMPVHTVYALNTYLKQQEIDLEDLDLNDKETILESRHDLAHDRFPELLTQPDHVLTSPMPLTPWQALNAANRLPKTSSERRERERLALKECHIARLMQEAGGVGNNLQSGEKERMPLKKANIARLMREDGGGGKNGFINLWLLQELRLSPLNALLLHSTFVTSRSLRIRDTWRWQADVLHYWFRDNTMMGIVPERPLHIVTSNGSDYSSRLGTPQLSRAASDGNIPSSSFQHYRTGSSDAITVHGLVH